jgi:uncharacterized protein YwgA
MDDTQTLNAREVILALLDSAPEHTLHDRNVVQRLCYFAAVALHEDLGYSSDFYGPVSRSVGEALEIAALAGQILEASVRLTDEGRDERRVDYTLTDDGRASVQMLRADHESAVETVQSVLLRILETVPDLNRRALSQAAKIHLLLSRRGEKLDSSALPSVASRLGWTLTDEDMRATTAILDKLQLTAAAA